MKCDSCIHKEVCKDKPPESYPQFMINIMTDKCEHYLHITFTFQTIQGARKNLPQLRAKMDGGDTYDKPT